MYNFCAFDLLGRLEMILLPRNEQNPIGIPKQEEISSVLQQCKALVDIRIEWFDHWEGVT